MDEKNEAKISQKGVVADYLEPESAQKWSWGGVTVSRSRKKAQLSIMKFHHIFIASD